MKGAVQAGSRHVGEELGKKSQLSGPGSVLRSVPLRAK